MSQHSPQQHSMLKNSRPQWSKLMTHNFIMNQTGAQVTPTKWEFKFYCKNKEFLTCENLCQIGGGTFFDTPPTERWSLCSLLLNLGASVPTLTRRPQKWHCASFQISDFCLLALSLCRSRLLSKKSELVSLLLARSFSAIAESLFQSQSQRRSCQYLFLTH